MATASKSIATLFCLAALLPCALAVNDIYTNGDSGNVTAVFLDNSAAFAVCNYPTSGLYSFLNRLLYYCVFIFSLFSRAHLWLVAGALAAALTYSGAAAVHACLLVWRGPNPIIEGDSIALYAILNFACLITVPLLNWSGTLRRLGAKATSIRDRKGTHTQSDVGTRTIVILWAFLVLVGFICIWVQYTWGQGDTNAEFPDMSKVMCAPGTNATQQDSAAEGYYNRSIDSTFVQDHGCTNPCNLVNIPSIFRRQDDLVLLDSSKAQLYAGIVSSSKSRNTENLLEKDGKILWIDYLTLPFILAQGFVAAMFGRRDPREIRDTIYIRLFMTHRLSAKPYLVRIQDHLARFLAALNYLLAVLVVLLCVPLCIATLIAFEIDLWASQTDAEKPYAAGQWAPWAVTAQVILAALITHDTVAYFVQNLWCRIFHRHHPQRDCKAAGGPPDDAEANHELDPIIVTEFSDRKPNDINDKNIQNAPTLAHPPSPSKQPPPSSPWLRLTSTLHHASHTLTYPLDKNDDQGLLGEARNFWEWCKDPQEVSIRGQGGEGKVGGGCGRVHEG